MSNETKWTKGPWQINGIAIEAGFEVIAYLREPAHFQGDIRPGHKDEAANAQLIVAATKLYAALADMVSSYEALGAPLPMAKEVEVALCALAEARGE